MNNDPRYAERMMWGWAKEAARNLVEAKTRGDISEIAWWRARVRDHLIRVVFHRKAA
jgi:hypothetical protein